MSLYTQLLDRIEKLARRVAVDKHLECACDKAEQREDAKEGVEEAVRAYNAAYNANPDNREYLSTQQAA